MRALLVGSAGRAPFAGHFRGRMHSEAASLFWAGRVKGSHGAEAAWAAAEAARDAMVELAGADRFALVDAAWAALRALNAPDLSVLLVAHDDQGLVVAACGLVEVRGDGRRVAAADHPLYDEPGVRERPGYFHPPEPAQDWVGVPVGARWSDTPVDVLCGARELR